MMEKDPLMVQLSINVDDSERLHEELTATLSSNEIACEDYEKIHPLHCTLAYYRDVACFEEIIQTDYVDLCDKEIDIAISGVVMDKHCIAYIVDNSGLSIAYYPIDKQLHLTMMLNGRPPVYSNKLIEKLRNKISKKIKFENDEKMIELKLKVTGRVCIRHK